MTTSRGSISIVGGAILLAVRGSVSFTAAASCSGDFAMLIELEDVRLDDVRRVVDSRGDAGVSGACRNEGDRVGVGRSRRRDEGVDEPLESLDVFFSANRDRRGAIGHSDARDGIWSYSEINTEMIAMAGRTASELSAYSRVNMRGDIPGRTASELVGLCSPASGYYM